MNMKNWLCRATIFIGAVSAAGANAESAVSVREFETRPTVKVRALVVKPEKPIGQVILLPGGGGDIGLTESGQITAPQMADNFTVRTRGIYADAGYVTVIPDTAGDMVDLMRNRESIAKNREDILAIAAAMKKDSTLPLWLVGTSASGWRLAVAAPELESRVGIAGIVLTATVVWAPEVMFVAASKITVPILIVHHHDDACYYSKPDAIPSLVEALKTASKKTVWIEGGSSQGNPCHERAYHGFNGKEPEAVGAILNWMASLGK